MSTKAILYSADSPDQEPALAGIDVSALTDRQLLWIDLASADAAERDAVARLLGCDPRLLEHAALLHEGQGAAEACVELCGQRHEVHENTRRESGHACGEGQQC